MDMTGILTNVGSFVAVVGTNKVLSSVAILMIAASIGGLAFVTIKRFLRHR